MLPAFIGESNSISTIPSRLRLRVGSDRLLRRLPNRFILTTCCSPNPCWPPSCSPSATGCWTSSAAEHAVRHPLQEAGFTKADVRALAKAWDLPTWDKPASPCLSSRLAPGVAVTPERTARVEAAEAYLRSLGLRECRVRLHEGELARIEVPLAELPRLAEATVRDEVVCL